MGRRGEEMLGWRRPEKREGQRAEILECGVTGRDKMLGWRSSEMQGP